MQFITSWFKKLLTFLPFTYWIYKRLVQVKKASTIKGVKPIKPRKKRDTTPLTKEAYKYVLFQYEKYINYNMEHAGNRKKTTDLQKRLNERLNMNKGITFYSRIWCGKVDYNSLPTEKDLLSKEN